MIGEMRDAYALLRQRVANNRDYVGSIVTSYGQIGLNIIVQLVLVPLYLSHLGKAQFGILMIVLGFINYLGMGVTWASSGAQRLIGESFAHGDHDGMQRVFGLAKAIFVAYALATSCVALVVVVLMKDSLFPGDPVLAGDVTRMMAIGVAYMVVMYDLNIDRLMLTATGRQVQGNLLGILALAVFAVVVVPALNQGWGLAGVMAANLLGVVVARIVSLIVTLRFGLIPRLPERGDRTALRRLIGPMGIGYALYGVLLLTSLQADTLILGALGGAVMVANYVLVWKVADIVMQALWRIPESLVPYLVHMDAKGDHARQKRIYVTLRKAMIPLAIITGALYMLFGQSVVELWVGKGHAPDEPLAYILAGGAVFWLVIARLPATYAFAQVRMRPLLRVSVLEVSAKLLILLIAFPFFGLASPLIAVNITHAMGVSVLYQRLYKIGQNGEKN